jgi:hypothetical protein
MLLFQVTKEPEQIYPKWPYVENIWKNVDKIVEDLIQDDAQAEKNKQDNPTHIADELNRFAFDSLMENDSYIHNLPPYSFIEKPMIVANTDEWIDLQQQYAGITEEKVNDNNPGEIFFDPLDQPETETYIKNPDILIAKRNITSAQDILDYLGSLMETTEMESSVSDERSTTRRSFFKPDLLPQGSEETLFQKKLERDNLNSTENLILTPTDILQAAKERNDTFIDH